MYNICESFRVITFCMDMYVTCMAIKGGTNVASCCASFLCLVYILKQHTEGP